MTQSNIPQYHHSYSKDENLSIYKYLKSATNKNLVENIFILCQSYPEEHQKKYNRSPFTIWERNCR